MNELEHALGAAMQRPQLFADSNISTDRLQENLLAINAELDAPVESRLARLLRRLGVPDLTIPLVTATPALRRSWFVAVAVAVLFALSVASNQSSDGVDRIVVFLVMAPVVPLLGVLLAFGRGVDPTHDLVVAAPRSTFMVFLIRSLTVLAASSVVLLVSSLLLPTGGFYRLAWLAPSIAVTATSLLLSSWLDARRATVSVAIAWVVLATIGGGVLETTTLFGPTAQLLWLVVAALASAVLWRSRNRFDDRTANL